ncbi:hypothetical protein ACLKA6_007118 [Drosophila palustris]
MAAVAAPTAVAVPAAAAAAATTTAATATATTTIGATIVKATTTTTTTLVGKLIGRLQNRTAELTEEAEAEDVDGRQGRGRGGSDSDSDSDSDSGVVGSSTPASYLSLYDEVASALDETQAEAEAEAEEAGYALIDDISEWLLSGVGGSSNSTLTPTSVSSSSSSSNETLTWLTLDTDTDTNTNTDEMQLQNTTLSLGPLSSGNSSDADGGGLYALRNFVEQQLNGGEASQDAEDIALIDSAEESALETVGDGETDYGGILGGFSYLDVATNELLQHTATRITNRTTVDADALWLSGAAAHTPNAAGGGAGGAGGAGGGTGTGTGAGTGGSSFMLLLENFSDYFPNYNGSTISGTTTASNILLDQNLTTLYIENYRTNCTNGTLNFTAESCPDLRMVDHNYWALILILFPILTLFGNILVILSVCRERSLQTVTNYFIVSLAIADLLVAVVVMPFAVYFLGRLSL